MFATFDSLKYYDMKKLALFTLFSIALISCGVNESEYNRVVAQRDSLQILATALAEKVDVLENGEDRLMNFINLHNENKNYIKALENIEALKKYHPESPLMKKYSRLFSEIEGKAQVVKDSIAKAVRDSIKLANINELGVWQIGDYVDDFGEPTGKHFVEGTFYGAFSNSATAGDRLRIRVRFAKSTWGDQSIYVDLKFDEYNNGTYEDDRCEYTKIVNKELRKVYEGYDPSGGGREKDGGWVSLEDMLMNEGSYEFSVRLEYSTRYQFTINSKYLNNALVKAGLKSIDEI